MQHPKFAQVLITARQLKNSRLDTHTTSWSKILRASEDKKESTSLLQSTYKSQDAGTERIIPSTTAKPHEPLNSIASSPQKYLDLKSITHNMPQSAQL